MRMSTENVFVTKSYQLWTNIKIWLDMGDNMIRVESNN